MRMSCLLSFILHRQRLALNSVSNQNSKQEDRLVVSLLSEREEQPPRSSDYRKQVEDCHPSGENRPNENLRQRFSTEFDQINEEAQHPKEAKDGEQ